MNEEKRRRKPFKRILRFFSAGMLLVLILFPLMTIAPKVFGIQSYVIISGSMEPSIPTGSLVYVRSTNTEIIQEGDIITFYSNRNSSLPTTHRVVENKTSEKEIITKGDANEKEDILPVRYADVLGKVVFFLPYLGKLLLLLSTVQGKIVYVMLFGFTMMMNYRNN